MYTNFSSSCVVHICQKENLNTFFRDLHQCDTRSRGYKTFFMLSSAETKIYPAHKCSNANICWHFNVYQQDKLQALMIRVDEMQFFQKIPQI